MITEDYVSFETAKLLKEKGFNCAKDAITAMYDETGKFCSLSSSSEEYYDYDDFDDKDFIAPTLQMAMKWLRDVHNIHIEIFYSVWSSPKWAFEIIQLPRASFVFGQYNERSYEEACESAIKYYLVRI